MSLYINKINVLSQVWWYMPIIPALRRIRQENLKFEVSLGYIYSKFPD
jgi:hypothetical protein